MLKEKVVECAPKGFIGFIRETLKKLGLYTVETFDESKSQRKKRKKKSQEK